MYEATQQFLSLDEAKKRAACIRLGEIALRVWEANFPEGCKVAYQESVTGSTQTLDCRLPREALDAVRAGLDANDIEQRYLESIAALEDDDLFLPEASQFAYYAIYNVFQRYVVGRKIDEWTIANQALASAGTPDLGTALSDVLREAV
ncbi:hypothetical protein [Dyella sp.]|uniref:hypothetical protein n=1 Tax=Dyella sp. TaxID=1869338 RepID=UPI003217965F